MTKSDPFKFLIILGSNRQNSNTLRKLKEHFAETSFSLIELNQLNIHHYEYSDEKTPDDFLDVAKKMVEAEVIVFATPVYWYAMSGHMKIFFDRLSDLISTSKPVGRALAGKETYLFSTGSDEELPEGFEVPFRRTSEYFDMKFIKSFYYKVLD